MEGPRLLFSGELTDPVVREIIKALPDSVRVITGGGLPELDKERSSPHWLILHRGTLTNREGGRLRRLRAAFPTLQVLLIVGPHVRHHQIVGWSELFDELLDEATASETIKRRFWTAFDVSPDDGTEDRPEVTVVSSQRTIQDLLVEMVEAGGSSARRARNLRELSPAQGLVVWDLPILEPDWEIQLGRALVEDRKILGCIGLANREVVRRAKTLGITACLSLPCDPDDLTFALRSLALASS